MLRWTVRGLFLASAVVLTIGFYYYAAAPNAADRAQARKAEPNLIYFDTTMDARARKPAP